MATKKGKKYSVIAKYGNNEDGSAKTVKYFVNNLLAFTAFLDRKFSTWTWMNVYDFHTSQQLTSFTKNKRPQTRTLSEAD